MDNETYDQFSGQWRLEWELNFLRENMNVNIISYQGEILGINLPNSVELKVVETSRESKATRLRAQRRMRSGNRPECTKYRCSLTKTMCF